MGEHCGSWFHRQKFHSNPHTLDHFGSVLDLGQKNTFYSYTRASTDMVSPNGTSSVSPSPELLHSQFVQANEPHAWFYCLPRFRQGFAPALNSLVKDKLPTLLDDDRKEAMPLKQETECVQKKFLVFDQSGDQTTLIYSSGLGNPAQCFSSWNPKGSRSFTLNNGANENREYLDRDVIPISTNDIGDNIRSDAENELHEDTEELNALLYSDEDNSNFIADDDDDEVTSTAQSPSTMTIHDNPYWSEENIEEVASSDGSNRKRKLFDRDFTGMHSFVDAARTPKPLRGLEYGDDAESKCDGDVHAKSAEIVSEPSNKRMREERIRETVSVLRNIVPNGKGKDAMVVLDEAILYLKSLKHKAKALGFDDAHDQRILGKDC